MTELGYASSISTTMHHWRKHKRAFAMSLGSHFKLNSSTIHIILHIIVIKKKKT
jgi:hypothetical protein